MESRDRLAVWLSTCWRARLAVRICCLENQLSFHTYGASKVLWQSAVQIQIHCCCYSEYITNSLLLLFRLYYSYASRRISARDDRCWYESQWFTAPLEAATICQEKTLAEEWWGISNNQSVAGLWCNRRLLFQDQVAYRWKHLTFCFDDTCIISKGKMTFWCWRSESAGH